MDGGPIVQLRQLGRRFHQHWAVRHIELSIDPGEMIGIVGADGAGKTTLLQMCAAILDPSEGECRVFGFDSVRNAAAITSRIGYMSQGFTLYDRLTAAENLRLSARIRDVPSDSYADRSERLLDMADLKGFQERRAGKLSGGMRKKLALCTNLIHEPRLLILDEPGLGVDPLSRRQLWEMLETFRDQGVTIAVATSYMEEAERCDRLLLLHDGDVVGLGTPEAIRGVAVGRVFELLSDEPNHTAYELEHRPDVYGLRVLPDRVRFQHAPVSQAAGESVPAERFAVNARQAPPTLEDVFVLHGGRQEDSAVPGEAPRPTIPGSIEARDLSVSFGDFRAVDHVSLEADAGSLLALLGPNGAGKTTLIRAFCGLVPVSEGQAYVSGTRVEPGAASIRQQIGYMSQQFSLYPDLTLAENLAFFASAYGMKRRDAAEAVRWATSMTGLPTQENQTPVAAMSAATRQRLALACSILHRPSVLFLDEPTSGVDPLSRYRFWRLIRSLADAGMVVAVTTHYLDEAEYCDRIGLMHRGRLIALGSLQALRQATGADPAAAVEEVFIKAIDRDGQAS